MKFEIVRRRDWKVSSVICPSTDQFTLGRAKIVLWNTFSIDISRCRVLVPVQVLVVSPIFSNEDERIGGFKESPSIPYKYEYSFHGEPVEEKHRYLSIVVPFIFCRLCFFPRSIRSIQSLYKTGQEPNVPFSLLCWIYMFVMTTVDNFFQALSLDISILQNLLKRHQCSHGRAIYFRRISMVLQATRRCQLLETGEHLQRFEQSAIEYCQAQKRKRNRKEDHWDSRRSLTSEQTALKIDYDSLQHICIESFPELLSRIDHASEPLFLEVSRGFFLPFCTVALSALARVRILILRIGRYILPELQQLLSSEEHLRTFLSFSNDTLEATMTKYLEQETTPETRNVGVGMVTNLERRRVLVKSLGYTLVPPRMKKEIISNPGKEKQDEPPPAIDVDVVMQGGTQIKAPQASLGTETNAGTRSQETDDADNDVGESVTFTDNVVIATKSTSGTVSEDSPMFREDNPDKDVMDRNMELLATFKSNNRGNERTSKEKKSKKRNEDHASSSGGDKKTKKSKKKRGKGDFFDALFD